LDGCDVSGGYFFIQIFWVSNETEGCDFGWEKNWMDVVKFEGIMRIDDMAWEKNFLDGFKRNCP
jgi:hypothetical protein